MSIQELYESGFKKRNRDHFAAIVHVAMIDGKVSGQEQVFLDRLARNLDVSEQDYKEILKDYASHPINPPLTYNARLERLYDLSRMVSVEQELGDKQHVLLERFGIGLGFTPENVKYVVDKALNLVSLGINLDNFIEEMKNMNR